MLFCYTISMKKPFIAGLVALALVLLCLPPFASAKDLSRLRVELSDDINKDCDQPAGFDPVWACASQDTPPGASAPIGTIVIRKDIPDQLLPFVFLRNVGLYLTWDLSHQQLADVFHPAPGVSVTQDIRDTAANAFAFWAMGGKVSAPQQELFRQLLVK
jgi:hypothetical protein